MNEEHSESGRDEEGNIEEPRREESQTLGTTQIVEVSIIIPLVVLVSSSN